VGNLSVGGTGKTPFTIFLAKFLQAKGYSPCVLSRGYKRKSKGVVPVSDGKRLLADWETAGDEPYLIGREEIPTVVGEDRYTAGRFALEKFSPDLFILDDGFQHYQLYRDADLLLVDATNPFWEDKLLPAGRLREPASFYRYADLLVVNRLNRLEREKREKVVDWLKKSGKGFITTEEKIEGLTDGRKVYPFDLLKGKQIGVFAGLGNNRQFFRLVKELGSGAGFQVVREVSLPDHYSYKNFKLPATPQIWITTEKDLIKLPPHLTQGKVYAVKYSLAPDREGIKSLENLLFYEKLKNKV